MTEVNPEPPALEFAGVGKVADFALGAMKAFKLGDREVTVVLLDDGWHAFGNYCPHAFAPISAGWIADGQVFCAFHYACFDLKTGVHISGPGWEGLPIHEVRVVGDEVQVSKPPSGRPPHLRFVSRSDDRWRD